MMLMPRSLAWRGEPLFVATAHGTTVWDLALRAQVAEVPGVTARLHDRHRRWLVGFSADSITVLAGPGGVP